MGDLHSYYAGGNLVHWDTHRKRIIHALGADAFGFSEDFAGPGGASAADTLLGWTTTLVEAGAGESTVAYTDLSGGAILISADAADNDGVNLQRLGEAFSFTSSQRLTYFGARLKISEATQSDILAGLCITDTDLLGGMTDGVYFRKVDASTSLAFVTEKDSSETSTTGVLTVAADTFYVLEFFWDGTTVEAFVDGVSVATHTLTVPNDELLTPSLHYLAGTTGGSTCTVDWVRAWQVGR